MRIINICILSLTVITACTDNSSNATLKQRIEQSTILDTASSKYSAVVLLSILLCRIRMFSATGFVVREQECNKRQDC